MKLFIDENISHRIVKLINQHFPDSIHVSSIRKKRFSDLDIWSYAKDNDFTIVTFDADFYEWQLILGVPPKVIWLRLGNTKTEIIVSELIESLYLIRNFISDKEIGLLEIHK
jgi:predicted nuclease of predicted toxin-antitoxin system